MIFEGYIFDVEGTLVDCVQQNLASLRDTLRAWGISTSRDTLQRYSGLDGEETLKLVAPMLSEEERKQVLKDKGTHYENVHLPTVQAFNGVKALFRSIRDAGGAIAFATDCKGAPLKVYRKLLDVDDLINHIACGEDAKKGKPDPELVRLAVQKLGLSPGRCVMIGDTPYDTKAAAALGVASIGLLSGGFDKKTLLEAGATDVVDGIASLAPLLGRNRVAAR